MEYQGLTKMITEELGGIYAQEVLADMAEVIRLYQCYDGAGQLWESEACDYSPTRQVTNFVRKLIDKEARFMFSRAPEITLEGKDGQVKLLQDYVRRALEKTGIATKLSAAGRDCFIGRRVALKLWQGEHGAEAGFCPSTEFVFETEADDADRLKKIIFFHALNDEGERSRQRIWKQRFYMENGRCMVDEAIYDGYGRPVEQMLAGQDTGLDFIPAYVIINDALTGDVKGTSDVALMMADQDRYNRLKSDEADALRFHLFPITVAKNASGKCLDKLRISPGALVDLQTDPAAGDGAQASLEKLESKFAYVDALEAAIARTKADMYALLEIPDISVETLSGVITSGKAMQTLYWELKCKAEERWLAWDKCLRWLVDALIALGRAQGEKLPKADYMVKIEHLYPVTDDEDAERTLDLKEVEQGVRSAQSYCEKWGIEPFLCAGSGA